MNLYDNASPRLILRGVEDDSGTVVTPTPAERPQHFPVIYTYAKKGKGHLQFMSPNRANLVYGDESFVENGPYATHATPLYKQFALNANSMAIKRVFPPDAAMASLRISADLLGPVDIPQYERDEQGQFVLDQSGKRIPTGAVRTGYFLKYVGGPITLDNDGYSTYRKMAHSIGDQAMDVNGTMVQSRRYPLFDILPPDAGSDGDNRGISIWANTENDDVVPDSALLTDPKARAFPFRIAQFYRPNTYTTGDNVRTNWNEDSMELVLKPGAYNSRVEQDVYLGDDFLPMYTPVATPGEAPIYGQFENFYVYDDNVKTILKKLMASEQAQSSDQHFAQELIGNANNPYLINMISARGLSGAPYLTIEINKSDANAIHLVKEAQHYMMGGSDGTMNQENFENAVVADMANWANPNHAYSEVLKYPVRCFYDTGFTMDNKKKIIPFIGSRKDLVLGLTPYTVGEPALTASQESSRALVLQSMARLYPESTFHGTSTNRCFIVGRHGRMIDSKFKGQLPLIIEVASWLSKMMGAGNGRWNSEYIPDSHPRNMIKLFDKVNATFVPGSAQAVDWRNGLNWVAAWDHGESLYMPSLQTVYPDDTSVLNSIFAAFACAEIQYLGARVHATFTGNVTLTEAEFREEVTKEYNRLMDRKFAGIFDTSVVTNIEGRDKQLGYAWHNQVIVAGDPAKTVMTLDIRTVRRS